LLDNVAIIAHSPKIYCINPFAEGPSMLRLLVTSMLMCASALSQTAPSQQPSNFPKPAVGQQQVFHPENVHPDTVVLEIQGVCSGLGDGSSKAEPCVTQITRDQFTTMIAAIGSSNPMMSTPAAQRSFAESYAQLLGLADAARKAGFDKDPKFLELMRIVQIRTMAEEYRRFLEDKATNPAPEEVEAYYKKNVAKYEQIKVERVIIPPVAARRVSAASAADANKKIKDLANEIRERAVKGEDMNVLQADTYKALGLPAPPNTDMGSRRRGTLPAKLEAELFALKPGEVTRIETEPAGYTVYRLRTHDVPSIDSVRPEILRDLHKEYVENTIKTTMNRVNATLNMDYFGQGATTKSAVSLQATPGHNIVIVPPSNGTSGTSAASTTAQQPKK